MKNLFPVILFAALGLFPQAAAAQVMAQATPDGVVFAVQGPDGGQLQFIAGRPVSPAQPGGLLFKVTGKDGSRFAIESRGTVRPELPGDPGPAPPAGPGVKKNGRREPAVRT